MGEVLFFGGIGAVFSVLFAVTAHYTNKASARKKLLKRLKHAIETAEPMSGQVMAEQAYSPENVEYAIAAKYANGTVYRVDMPMQVTPGSRYAVGQQAAMRALSEPLPAIAALLNTKQTVVSKNDPPFRLDFPLDRTGCVILEADYQKLQVTAKKQLALCRRQELKYALMASGSIAVAGLMCIVCFGLML